MQKARSNKTYFFTTLIKEAPTATSDGFGFNIKEISGKGIFINAIEPLSVAARNGLKSGDQIMHANSIPFNGIQLQEALKILRSCTTLELCILRNSDETPKYTWMDRHGNPTSPPTHSEKNKCIKKFISLEVGIGENLGLMIRGGSEYGLGIYVTGVDAGSVAMYQGIQKGDEILEVNGRNFRNLTHDKAVSILKTTRKMDVILREVGKIPVAQSPFSAGGAGGGVSVSSNSINNTMVSSTGMDEYGIMSSTTTTASASNTMTNPVGMATTMTTTIGGGGATGAGLGMNNSTLLHPYELLDNDLITSDEDLHYFNNTSGGGVGAGGSGVVGGPSSNTASTSLLNKQAGAYATNGSGLNVSSTGNNSGSNSNNAGTIAGTATATAGTILRGGSNSSSNDIIGVGNNGSTRGTSDNILKSGTSLLDDFNFYDLEEEEELLNEEENNNLEEKCINMIEEKARTVLNKLEHSRFTFYRNEYTNGFLTVHGFVNFLIELLNTCEKYTLLTEVRELIRPSDLKEFDDLIYSKEKSLLMMDSNAQAPPSMLMHHSSTSLAQPSTIPTMPANGTCGLRVPINIPNNNLTSSSTTDLLVSDSISTTPHRRLIGRQNILPNTNSSSNNISGGNGSDYRLHEEDDIVIWEHPPQHPQDPHGHSRHNNFGSQGFYDRQLVITSDPQAHSKLQPYDPNNVQRNSQSQSRKMSSVPAVRFKVRVMKTKPILGIAIEGGIDTPHRLPRIIDVNPDGSASDSQLRIGQVLLTVDGIVLDGKRHEEIAKTILSSYNDSTKNCIEFIVVQAKSTL